MDFAWLDGRLVSGHEASLPLEDRGLLHGDGAFETIRMHRGAPFRLSRHLQRLEASLRLLGLSQPIGREELIDGAHTFVATAGMDEGLLRIAVTAPGPRTGQRGHVAMTLRPLLTVPETVTLHVATVGQRLPGPLSRAKTLSRALEEAALREAQRAGAFDAVLLNPAGHVVETTSRNVFLVSGSVARTPSLEEGALPGVTREAILELASATGLRTAEEAILLEDLAGTEEIFLTGSGVGVLGVSSVGPFHNPSVPGPVTRRLADAYREVVDREVSW